MFELAQTPFHTPAIPRLWDKVLQLILYILELEGTHEGCGTLLLLKLVVMIVVMEHTACLELAKRHPLSNPIKT